MAKILLIEDEEDERAFCRMQLESLGHVVVEAVNGEVGLKVFRDEAPDLVLTDLVMPVMEGFETIQELKRLQPQARILAMSRGGTNPASAYLRVAQKLGASQVLAKPFSLEELDVALGATLPPELHHRPHQPLTFLVLDDNPDGRLLNRTLLEHAFPRSTVVECNSPGEAINASARLQLDAVITDHHLGESDGSEFVHRLRAQGAQCPVVMVTNSSDPKVHARAYAAGASRVFFGGEMNFTGYLREKLGESSPAAPKSESSH